MVPQLTWRSGWYLYCLIVPRTRFDSKKMVYTGNATTRFDVKNQGFLEMFHLTHPLMEGHGAAQPFSGPARWSSWWSLPAFWSCRSPAFGESGAAGFRYKMVQVDFWCHPLSSGRFSIIKISDCLVVYHIGSLSISNKGYGPWPFASYINYFKYIKRGNMWCFSMAILVYQRVVRGWDWCPFLGILNIIVKYLLDIISPIVGWCSIRTFTNPW